MKKLKLIVGNCNLGDRDTSIETARFLVELSKRIENKPETPNWIKEGGMNLEFRLRLISKEVSCLCI